MSRIPSHSLRLPSEPQNIRATIESVQDGCGSANKEQTSVLSSGIGWMHFRLFRIRQRWCDFFPRRSISGWCLRIAGVDGEVLHDDTAVSRGVGAVQSVLRCEGPCAAVDSAHVRFGIIIMTTWWGN